MADGRELVFVYGTLRRGASNHWRLESAEFLGGGTVAGRLFRIGWYPGLILGGAEGVVKGELYRVGTEGLDHLDRFEGCRAQDPDPHEYRRVRAEVTTAEGGAVEAWVWEFIAAIGDQPPIASGDWLDR